MTDKLSDEQAQELIDGEIVDGWKLIETNTLGHGRWDLHMQEVFRRGTDPSDYEYYVVEYSTGATECQDYGPFINDHGPAKQYMKVAYEIQ